LIYLKNTLSTAALLILMTTTVGAANKVVVVPLFGSSPTGIAAIPVYCNEAVLSAGASGLDNITCQRADTRAVITPVPAGHFLFITDIVVNRNSLVSSGRAFITVGRNSGGTFVSSPRFNFSIENITKPNHLTFSTPYLVFREGESIGAINGDSTGSGVAADIFISGYLVEADEFGN